MSGGHDAASTGDGSRKDRAMSDPSEEVVVEASEAAAVEAADPVEATLEVYPLREASEDPGWAVKTVWVWLSIAIGLLIFFLVLMVLGFWYD